MRPYVTSAVVLAGFTQQMYPNIAAVDPDSSGGVI